jgi:hypothetical protein
MIDSEKKFPLKREAREDCAKRANRQETGIAISPHPHPLHRNLAQMQHGEAQMQPRKDRPDTSAVVIFPAG